MTRLSDDELLHRLSQLTHESRGVEAELIAHLAEVDARRLYAREACPSLFSYCTERLDFSEAEAYLRIAAARASRQHPVLLEMLGDGRLHLSGIERLAPHLTAENRDAVLPRAVHKSRRQIEELLAELSPRRDVRSLIRKLPVRHHEDRSASTAITFEGHATAPVGIQGGCGQEATTVTSDCSGQAAFEDVRPVAGCTATATERSARSVPPGLRPDGVACGDQRPAGSNAARPPATVEPIAPDRYKVQFTASRSLRDKLERLRTLMRMAVPDGDLAAVIEEAVTEKLRRLETHRYGLSAGRRQDRSTAERGSAESTRRLSPPPPGRDEPGATARLRPAADSETPANRPLRTGGAGAGDASSRHIPAAARRAVWLRDGGRCRYVDQHGRRCTSTEPLEFHHRHPYGYGGGHDVENICLMCPAHNRYIAAIDYGPHRAAVAGRRRRNDTVIATATPPQARGPC